LTGLIPSAPVDASPSGESPYPVDPDQFSKRKTMFSAALKAI
jgi:hypothetical protein